MLTSETLDKIERDAKQATPGRWMVDPSGVNALGSVGTLNQDVCQTQALVGDSSHTTRRFNTAHIANCDPQTIAELVKMARLALLISEKLISGNDVPVDRITIKRDEYQAIAGERG